MELYQLRYFQAVAECGTLREAAERLSVSQSAVSRAVAMLEAEIGVPLFTRRGRANELNRFGETLLNGNRRIQRSLDAAVAGVRELAGADGGNVALGFLHSLGLSIVPELIRSHHDRFPQANFTLHQSSGHGLLTDLVDGVTDLALSDPEAFQGYDEIRWHTLYIEQLYAVVGHKHPLARRSHIGLPELADHPFVVLDSDHTLRRILDLACNRYGLKPYLTFEGRDIATLRGLIGANLGVGVLPAASPRPSNIVEIDIDDDQLVRPIAIGWVEDRYLPPSAGAFRDTALAAYPPARTQRKKR